MSGSGGGGGGGRSYDDVEIPCSKLKFDAQVSSPQPAVVSTLSPGDVLDVRVTTGVGTQSVQVFKGTQLVGGLVGNLVPRLRECLLANNNFKATVLSVNSGQVKVRVEPV